MSEVTHNMVPQSAPVPVKPLMRGWLHAAAAVFAVILTVVMIIRSAGSVPKAVSVAIFGASLIELYTVSAVYHLGPWQPGVKKILRSIDHSNIFIVIAGTYTPLCVNILSGVSRIALLSVIWGVAAVGIVLAIFTSKVPRWIHPILYVVMGWIAVFAMPEFLAAASWTLLILLITGGALYTVGALVYSFKWPNPFPKVFGYHEVFHFFTIAGGGVMAVAIWIFAIARP